MGWARPVGVSKIPGRTSSACQGGVGQLKNLRKRQLVREWIETRSPEATSPAPAFLLPASALLEVPYCRGFLCGMSPTIPFCPDTDVQQNCLRMLSKGGLMPIDHPDLVSPNSCGSLTREGRQVHRKFQFAVVAVTPEEKHNSSCCS